MSWQLMITSVNTEGITSITVRTSIIFMIHHAKTLTKLGDYR